MRDARHSSLSVHAAAVLLLHGAGAAAQDAASDEILVTARKVPEEISRVPMSVQALSAEHLERRGIANFYDLQYEVPGLVLNNRGMFGAGISLRGVADEGGSSLAVAPHFNGVYLGRSNLVLARPFDLERIEVVKGPQGTLYGRNATGGSVNVISRAPDAGPAAAAEASWGSFDTVRIGGHVNVGGGDVSARIAVAGAEGDGFIRNSVDTRRFAAEDYRAARVSVRARPTDALTIDATLQRVEDDGASGELWLPRPDQLPDRNDIRLTRVTAANVYQKTDNDFASLNLGYEVDGVVLRSVTGYARSVTRDVDDCAGIPQLAGCVRSVQPLRYEQYSQELRLESHGEGSVDWLAGLYYFESHELQNFALSLASQPLPVNDYRATSDETAYAVFGDVTWSIDARWRLNGGARFSRENNGVSTLGSGTSDIRALVSSDGSWDAVSWRAGIDFSPDDRWFVYANVSTGFKSGGATATPLPNGTFDDFAPEKIVAYEAGTAWKSRAGRSSLRASAFAYDFDDLQITTTAIIAGVPRTVVDNAAAARIHGIDASASARIAGGLTASAAVVWLPRREFVDFVDRRGISFTGNHISRALEWSASASLEYRVPLAQHGELGVDLDYNWRSSFHFTKDNTPFEFQEAFGLLNLNVRFEPASSGWYAFAAARNLLDEDYFTQIFLQSAPGYPTRYEVGAGWRF
jgi:iron complex outermembrane receptor protein